MNWMRVIIGASMMVALAAPVWGQMEAAHLKNTDGGFVVTGGDGKNTVTFEIDAKQTGFIAGANVGDKKLVDANHAPPLFASVLESAQYDGFADFAGSDGGKVVGATYHLDQCTAQQKGNDVEVMTTGHLDWPGGDAIKFVMTTTLQASGHVAVAVQATRSGAFQNRFLRDFGLQLPLSLNERKRVAQGGDRGMRFDTRYEYQYHSETKFLESADFNFWQHFWVDQSSPVDYHMWRSESLATSGLTEFRGRLAPGWITAYDQQGGVLFSYKDMPARAPKALYVGARGSGVNIVYFHAPTHAAMSFQDSAAVKRAFDCQHQTDWIFFNGPEFTVKPDQILEKIWNQKLASDAPERADEELNSINLLDAHLTAGATAPLVVGGVPLPQGQVTALTQLALSYESKEVPLQTQLLGYWPDGSYKWVLLVFPLDPDTSLATTPTKGTGQQLPLTITLRSDKPNPDKRTYVLRYGKDVTGGTTTSALKASGSGQQVQINTGPLELKLGTGQHWLQEATLNGRSVLRSGSDATSYADFIRVEKDHYPAPNAMNIEGKLDDGALNIDNMVLEESGPLRAVVRLEGKTTSKEPERVIIRLEAYAGRSYVRMFHTIEFLHKDPRLVYMRRMGIDLPLNLDVAGAKAAAGAQSETVALAETGNWRRLGLTQDNYMHFSAWRQGRSSAGDDRFLSIAQEGNRSRGWLDVSDSKGGVAVFMRDMWQEAPSELVVTASSGGASLNVNLWPEHGAPMDLRRYSNYGHMSQGESAGEDSHDNSFWSDKIYYAPDRGPIEGVSKTHEFLIYFHDASATSGALDSLAADFQSPALVYAGAAWYAQTRITLPTIAPGDPRFAESDKNLDRSARFLLFHQKYWNWYGCWDYGDVGHMFKRGYGQYIPADELKKLLKMSAAQRDDVKSKDMGAVVDYWPQHDWAFDNGRWGWSNTEGLTNLFMQNEYLRTGDRDIYFFAESAAHEARDVEMRHEGRYFGYGTRHGVQHWSDGNHEQRQTTNTEFRIQYFLSGDRRSAEFAQELTDKFYLVAPISGNNDADHSARLYGLLFAWERTNDSKVATTLKNYIHSLCVPEGLDTYSSISFPDGRRTGQPEKKSVNDGGFFFQYFGSMHGLLEYYEITQDQQLRDSMVKYAGANYAASKKGDMLGGDGKKSPPILAEAFAARYADNKQVFAKALADRISKGTREMYTLVYETWPVDPKNWTGLTAPVKHYPSQMFWLNSEGYVLSALDKEPALTTDQIQKMNQYAVYTGAYDDKTQSKVQVPSQRESWQNEFDDPALKSYCIPKRPLEP